MADLKFKTGDQVQLISGGPNMTVNQAHDNGQVSCAWFVKQDMKTGTFFQDALRTYEEDDSPGFFLV